MSAGRKAGAPLRFGGKAMKLGTYNYSTHEAFDMHGVPLGKFPDNQQARDAMYAARLPRDFFRLEQISPIPLLQELNNWVIKQNENRLPKWKFKFDPDLGAQIQSKITRAHVLLFKGIALRTDDLTVKLFTEPKQLQGRSYFRISFELFCDEPNSLWSFHIKSAWRGKGCPSSGLLELRRRILEALHPDCFSELRPDRMLSPQCLCCGKGLTDPASMARWIGPECWGSASTNIPRLFKAETVTP
jgi:Family of unknown function (DUF6011)